LLPPVQKDVQGVAKLGLQGLLALQELNVVEDQDIAVIAVSCLEGGNIVVLDVADHIAEKALGRLPQDAQISVFLKQAMANGLSEVCLAQARRGVDEQRVVRAGKLARDLLCRRAGKRVRGTGHKGGEGIPGVPFREGFLGSCLRSMGGGVFFSRRRAGWFLGRVKRPLGKGVSVDLEGEPQVTTRLLSEETGQYIPVSSGKPVRGEGVRAPQRQAPLFSFCKGHILEPILEMS
jgi:hypothetical protein